MHISFDKIRFKNFLSSGNVFTEIKLNKNKNTLIIGKNGNGKSLLIEAICFALFNKPYRNINKPQLVNSVNGKNMVVELYFSIGDDKFIIKRGMKPVIFEIIRNGTLVNQDADSRDYQEYFESSIIKLRHKSFTQTSIMGTASFVPFMQLTANNRRLFMEDLLSQQIFTTMNTLQKAKQTEIKTSLSELETEIKILVEKIALHQNFMNKIESDKGIQISDIQNKISLLEAENVTHEASISELQKTISELEKGLPNVDATKSKLEKLNKYEAKITNNKSQLEKTLRFFSSNDQCPTCKQDITLEFKSNAIAESNNGLSELENEFVLLNEYLEKYNSELNRALSIQKEISLKEREIYSHQSDINSNSRNIIQLEKELNKISSDDTLSISENEFTQLKQDHSTKIKEREDINKKKERMENILILLKDDGIKAQITRKYIPIINKSVNSFLEKMNFYVNFNLDEQFNETIKSRHRDIFSYESFSEGEKMRLNLALVFTWRAISKKRSSTTSNLLFFDEIMDSSLDYDGIDTFFKMIDDLGHETNVFVISHKTDMIDKFSNIIKVEKVKNFSKWTQQ
ncbi:MAG: recombinase [Candidatus Levybacteria bacterium]|nr:recombinase [Candidatus Levybacteria bacterium]